MNHRSVVELFRPEPGSIYLNSATFGLPPLPTTDAVRKALDAWQEGSAHWIHDWDLSGEACRRLAADLLKARPEEVSLMPAVSVASGIVASAVPEGGEVLIAEGDFTSVTYPFLELERTGRLRVREVPLDALASEVRDDTAMVAVSHVQSSSGETADMEAISEAVRRVDARLYVDVSQSLGVVPFDVDRPAVDYLACAAYKWLCCPRGVAFLYVRRSRRQDPTALAASWRAGDDPYGRFYGTPLALADTAARFDVSLAWYSWVGAQASLEVLSRLDDETRFALANGAARVAAERLGLPAPGAGIVSVPVTDAEGAEKALHDAGIRASSRAGKIRLSFHFYNTDEHAERAAEVLRPWLKDR